eukprot:NODE_6684_length_509_cov_20.345550_g6518_i0.p1 GENE.NODE_6684_length_509_cov_20.345550_g6518_i0~~NODE_6684_length_509_cov_20.345550_g6518_i0.p1  ORF type:complete len:160 (+),score=40.14 NODE_6684_length_509_cov_20.345550_g6518_i0:67-480(+)
MPDGGGWHTICRQSDIEKLESIREFQKESGKLMGHGALDTSQDRRGSAANWKASAAESRQQPKQGVQCDDLMHAKQKAAKEWKRQQKRLKNPNTEKPAKQPKAEARATPSESVEEVRTTETNPPLEDQSRIVEGHIE